MAKTKAEDSSSDHGLENLTKVRELLFGSQLGEVESKISSTEKQLGLELKSLGTQTQANIDGLESFTRAELDNLTQLLNEERTRREDLGDDSQAALDRAEKAFDKQLTALDDTFSETTKTLRQKTQDSIKELREQTQQQIQAVQEFVKATDARLSEERVHRDVLAGLFRDVAAQLDSNSIDSADAVSSAPKDSGAE